MEDLHDCLRLPTPRRICIIASASGNGKTTLGRRLAQMLKVPFVELDSLVHGPGWTEISDARLGELLAPVLRGPGWVIDGTYQRKLGTRLWDTADLILWLDLPIHIWFLRLLCRSARRWSGREQLWNGNRERLRDLVWGRGSLFGYAFITHARRRLEWPLTLARYRVVRLRTPQAVIRLRQRLACGSVTPRLYHPPYLTASTGDAER